MSTEPDIRHPGGTQGPTGRWSRREFLRASLAAGAGAVASAALQAEGRGESAGPKPLSVVFVFADQWRAQALGCAGDTNARTPNLDALAARAVRFTTAVSTCPVCSPYRASLLTGRYPLAHGVFLNDVHLASDSVSIARVFKAAGYDTGYIGKWHVNGRGRLRFIPPEDRQGFDFWRACECTHAYNKSIYYADDDRQLAWEGYDAEAQARAAQEYIRGRGRDPARPFLLVLSWGPPHNPYETAPQRFREMFDPKAIRLRPNVPPEAEAAARRDLAGYYAHCAALDTYVGDLLRTIRETGQEDRTLFVFTSDHGDMLGSQGQQRKQRPWDEAVMVPLIVHCPSLLGRPALRTGGREVRTPIGTPDLMPTLLGLCGISVPKSVEGLDYSGHLARGGPAPADAALIACYTPFGEWTRAKGGREYRGIRTERHTFVRTIEGPWLLFDNQADPHQAANLVGRPEHSELQARLDDQLKRILAGQKDEFLPGAEYIKRWGYKVDAGGTAPAAP